MLVELLFVGLVLGAGLSLLVALGVRCSWSSLGLAAPVGLAALAIITSWMVFLRLPPAVSTVVAVAPGLASIGIAVRALRRREPGLSFWTGQSRALLILAAATLTPVLAFALAMPELEVPLSPADGSSHVAWVHALRQGEAWTGWYPQGFHASVAAVLRLVPDVDSAAGATAAALGLTVLAPLAGFGLALAAGQRPHVSAIAALALALTYRYPYEPQTWSGWPLAAGMLLVMGLWSSALLYTARPALRWAMLGGVLAAGVLWTHGSEVYTAVIGLAVIALARGRHEWRRLLRDGGVALALALVLTAPYLTLLVSWAGHGGAQATAAGVLDGTGYAPPVMPQPVGEAGQPTPLWVSAVSAVDVDAPARALLLFVGTWWTFRMRTGRTLVALLVVFMGVTAAFTRTDLPPIRRIFELTFPWGMDYRLILIPAVLGALLTGIGLVAATDLAAQAARRLRPSVRLRVARAGRVLVVGLLLALGGALTLRLSLEASLLSTYSADDAHAMAWLRTHSGPGEVLVNDANTDAAVWAPYKAGTQILVSRDEFLSAPVAWTRILSEITEPAPAGEARAVLCVPGVHYLYRSSIDRDWAGRRFPPAARLREMPWLEEVFHSGETAVFRLRIPCDV